MDATDAPAKRSSGFPTFFITRYFSSQYYFFLFALLDENFRIFFLIFFNRKFRKVLSNQGFHFRSNQGFCRLSLEEEKDYKSLFFLIRFRKNYLKFLFIFFMTHWNYNVLSADFFFLDFKSTEIIQVFFWFGRFCRNGVEYGD